MRFLEHLMQKPWLADQGEAVDLAGGKTFNLSIPVPNLGLRIFLIVVTILFTAMSLAYVERMSAADWRSMPEPWLLWVNTAMLFLSSLAMHRAWTGAYRGSMDDVRNGLLVGGGFAFIFLAGQFWAWQELIDLGYFAKTNPANAFFYLITGAHALHLLGGVVAWGRTMAKVWWRGFEVDRVRVSVELCTIYWHFLLVVWVGLFSLILFT